ncbi:MAG TPA: proton-conducting transporter membrane subunit [Candidatus Binatia bacterium]|nr:proton-conducting transporter membrane subunit [Candidatus Binatia bacterium]
MQFAPLPVVIPLIVAAAMAAGSGFLHRRVLDLGALATSAAVLAITLHLTAVSSKGVIVYWFGGWQPVPYSHFPIGICFMIDPFGAGLASLVSLLVLAAFIFSWSYFESVKALYHTVMLVFLAAMCGLCLTGDLFNLFVWFELMTAAGVALCGYKSEESQPLQGALNFAVTNTIGAFTSLIGVGLLYSCTGSLNMAEVGATLSRGSSGHSFLIVGFLFLIAGFLVKSATVPFHFWLADAHAVAPTPVCILFSGVMVELGLYAIARIYWIVFAAASQPMMNAIRTLFLTVAVLTAILGALYCYGQRHLKRMLAFSTISHVGLMLLAFGLLDPSALAGGALYLLGHGMIKASLFIGAGILLHRFRSVDEYDLGRVNRQIIPIALMMIAGAWGLAGLPPFATYFGAEQFEHAAAEQHLTWLAGVIAFSEIMTSAAVLRFTGRALFNLGRGYSIASRGAPHIHMEVETHGKHSRVPAFMWLPMALLLLAAIFVTIPIRHSAAHYAAQFENAPTYESVVLGQNPSQFVPPQHASIARNPDAASTWWTHIVVVVGMFLVAALGIFPRRRNSVVSRALYRAIGYPLLRLRPLQSGRVGDYVAWMAFGIGAYGAVLLLLR